MTRQTVRAIIKNSNGEILLIERHKEGRHYFALPGGHVNQGESLEQALVREVLEETSLKVEIEKKIKSETDDLGNLQHIYECKSIDGTPRLSQDSIEFEEMDKGQQSWDPKWVSSKDLEEKTVYPRWLLGGFIFQD